MTAVPRLLAVSNGSAAAGGDLVAWALGLAELGVDAVQLREKALPARQLLDLASELRRRLPPSTALLVNGRADVALAAGAEGVHLSAAAGPTAVWRRRYPELLLGRSAHSRSEVDEARDGGADYVVYGPVRPPRSKASLDVPAGFEGLRRATALGIPVLAIGGLGAGDWPRVRACGAHGLAAISLFRSGSETASLLAASR